MLNDYTTREFDCMIYGFCGGDPPQFGGEDALYLLSPFLKEQVELQEIDESGNLETVVYKPHLYSTRYGEKIYIALEDGCCTHDTDWEFNDWPTVIEWADESRNTLLEHMMHEVFFLGHEKPDGNPDYIDDLWRLLTNYDSPVYKYTEWLPRDAVDGFWLNMLILALPEDFLERFFDVDAMREAAEKMMSGLYVFG